MNAKSKSNANRVDALVRKEVRAAAAYTVPPADGLIKLDAMENPHSLPDELKTQWLARLREVEINRYPDPQCASLKRRIRATLGIDDAHGLMLGNGSDELIQMIAMLVGGPRRSLLAPTPTFAMYPLISAITGGEFIGVPLRADFNLDGDALLDTLRQRRPACVFLAYPNNPTGNRFDEGVIAEVLKQAPGLVVIDEAYFSFCRRSFLAHIETCPHLLILRTLSKSGMAGLRLGMLIAQPHWIEQLEKVRLPYNINSLTQCSAEFYLEHHDIMQQQADQIVNRRNAMFARLENLPLRAYPSDANFILFKLERDAEQVYNRLKERGILIKNLHHAGGDAALKNCLRVTIGAEDECERFIEALRDCLK